MVTIVSASGFFLLLIVIPADAIIAVVSTIVILPLAGLTLLRAQDQHRRTGR